MATKRKRAGTPEPLANQTNENGQTDEPQRTISGSGYEEAREERIKENLQRMQKLGIVDLSLKLKSVKPTRKNNFSARNKTPSGTSPLLPPSGPTRRSSRLQSLTPVTYSELRLAKDGSVDGEDDLLREVGSKPEVYTEEHEKLLGNTEMSWTLFVDGYGKDGKRIYDPVKGKTCHQCRQKTMGHRTHCSKCSSMVQGQFCGDCLYIRYGEHVLEANQNPNWICPVCRGICNCSLCRQAKGWPATGTLYRKISNLGFKSVAHYLIQTRRSNTDSENSSKTVPASAKRSLPFSDMEAMPEETVALDSNNIQDLVDPEAEYKRTDDGKGDEKEAETNFSESSTELIQKPVLANGSSDELQELSKLKSEENGTHNEIKGDKEKMQILVGNDHCGHSNVAPKSGSELKQKPAVFSESSDDHPRLSESESGDREIYDELKVENEEKILALGNKHDDGILAVESSPKSKKKPALVTEPDSIAGRLKHFSSANDNVNFSSSAGPSVSEGLAGRLRSRCKRT